ncbi:T-cell surface glycoprotein CD3 epsilon chain [Echeneis naucrates]|uniref:CD3 gamma/delta subunit Ig-like domain-containing protein n=1 Tax=Echeneis naucrates TaxID=173247 RepID=A0A665TZX6_ECHNA|nr:T-cell surface glycoprotein CD3 epsilon chain [Echeneis naucrates]
MDIMGLRFVLAILLLEATVKAEEDEGQGSVTFWQEKFTLTCPESGKWYRKKLELKSGNESKEFEQIYTSENKGFYHCKYEDSSSKDVHYYFYVKGKVCKSCFELDENLFALIIVADVLGTAVVMLIIYMSCKKKHSGGSAPRSAPKAPAHSRSQGPPVPSPDYEQLNPHTRGQDPYSTVNRMG